MDLGVLLRLPACCVLVGLVATPAAAGTIRVPAEVADLQAALAVAGPGDTVLVAPGSYPANLVWPATPGIKLLSEAGATATILDARQLDQVLGIYTGADSTTLIRGFTLTGGIAGGT